MNVDNHCRWDQNSIKHTMTIKLGVCWIYEITGDLIKLVIYIYIYIYIFCEFTHTYNILINYILIKTAFTSFYCVYHEHWISFFLLFMMDVLSNILFQRRIWLKRSKTISIILLWSMGYELVLIYFSIFCQNVWVCYFYTVHFPYIPYTLSYSG